MKTTKKEIVRNGTGNVDTFDPLLNQDMIKRKLLDAIRKNKQKSVSKHPTMTT
jgi:hypothetical protein